MTLPVETPLSSAAADALSGTTDPITGAIYNTIGQAQYYTDAYRKEKIWNRAMGLSNGLRVVQDGTLTVGVMPGPYRIGNAYLDYAGSTGNALIDDATNTVYIGNDGVLHITIAALPAENILPLADVVTASGAITSIKDWRGLGVFCTFGVAGKVEPNTGGSGSPNTLLSSEYEKIITNEGATARAYNILGPAIAGAKYTFVIQDADGMRITAAAGDTIRPGCVTASAAAGYIQCATPGAMITLLAINATEWIATAMIGTWTVDS